MQNQELIRFLTTAIAEKTTDIERLVRFDLPASRMMGDAIEEADLLRRIGDHADLLGIACEVLAEAIERTTTPPNNMRHIGEKAKGPKLT